MTAIFIPSIVANRGTQKQEQMSTIQLSSQGSNLWNSFQELGSRLKHLLVAKRQKIKAQKALLRTLIKQRQRGEASNLCPDCGNRLEIRWDQYGSQRCCSTFPNCTYTTGV